MNKNRIFKILFLSMIGILLCHIQVSANMSEESKNIPVCNGTEELASSDIQMPRSNILSYVSLPSKYGIDTSKTVYNQGDVECCWAMAGTSLFEYAVDKKNNISNTAFSAEHMLEKLAVNGKCGFTATSKSRGGHNELCAAYFVSGYGPVSLKNYPWFNSPDFIANYDFGTAEYRATDVMYLPSTREKIGSRLVLTSEAKNILKQSIYNYGAAMASMNVPDDFWNYVGDDASYYEYNMNTPISNHSVLIVGWDDNWSKNNFKNPPQNDGAWLVRNSWGEWLRR